MDIYCSKVGSEYHYFCRSWFCGEMLFWLRMDKERLEALISGYRDQAKPLMDDMNVRLGGVYPENCLNEIRAMLDHVSRCYHAEELSICDEEKESISNEELSKAEGHLRRLMYDCFKQWNILL